MNRQIMIIGAGYSGKAFVRLVADSAEWIGGTTRSDEHMDVLRTTGIEPFLFDGKEFSEQLRDALKRTTHLVASAGPDDGGDPFLRCLDGRLTDLLPDLRWCGYLSTVGVYGNHDGDWVDENSECRPVSKRSRQRVAAEESWQRAAGKCNIPLAILRLSGIYGPGRNACVNLANGTAKRLVKPGQVFNRIHVADIAGALDFLSAGTHHGVFNVTDEEPAPPQDVVTYAAGRMGVEPPPEVAFADAELSPMARSFYGENKRVSNAKIRKLGYRFRYPDYRKAFSEMCENGNWADPEC